jgi:hypothetical protein
MELRGQLHVAAVLSLRKYRPVATEQKVWRAKKTSLDDVKERKTSCLETNEGSHDFQAE